MEHLQVSINQLLEELHSVVPIYTRTQPLIEPIRGVMLCDYFTYIASLREGQEVLVLSNGIAKSTPSTSSCTCSITSSYSVHHETDSLTGDQSATCSLFPTEESVEPAQNTSTETSCCPISRDTSGDTTTTYADVTRYTWLVKTIEEGIEAEVPGVCVALTETDYSALEQVSEMREELSTFWKRIIDDMLLTGMKMFSSLFETLLTREVVWIEDFRLFEDFLDELDRALVQPSDSSVSDTVNKTVREQISMLRSRYFDWRQALEPRGSNNVLIDVDCLLSCRTLLHIIKVQLNQCIINVHVNISP
ncbi:hypothetical protein AAHC03_0955 [Spirometra sp. Aus1]